MNARPKPQPLQLPSAAMGRSVAGTRQQYGGYPTMPSPNQRSPGTTSTSMSSVNGGRGFNSSGYAPTTYTGGVKTHQPQSVSSLSKQHLSDLNSAFSGLEGFDEAAYVHQAKLGLQMQSQLQNLLDYSYSNAAADTPYARSRSFSLASDTSPKAQAAALEPESLPKPGPSYDGPCLEPLDSPITLAWVMSLVHHFQHNPSVPLPARYLCRILADAERLLDERNSDGPIWQLTLNDERLRQHQGDSQYIIVGDTHGQLADVLWIFFKMGVPSSVNRYLINGDICDRGDFATEIWALALSFMCLWPESVVVHRGNHEDRLMNMDGSCGGFRDEVLYKYGRFDGTGAIVYEKFARLFAKLPLASVLDKKVFIVHGGLGRCPPASFMRLLRSCRVRGAEVPASTPGASASDLAFADAMWADPQEQLGISPNPRGTNLVMFGPDITNKFLSENGFGLLVRSHQVPPNNDGFYQHHGGKTITVFSASNYCGVSENHGAVLVLRADGSCEAARHWAPSFSEIAKVEIEPPDDGIACVTPAALRRSKSLKRMSSAAVLEEQSLKEKDSGQETSTRAKRLESEVLQGAAKLIVEHKQALFIFWEQCDTNPPRGFITTKDWKDGMQAVLGDSLPWGTIGKVLRVKDSVAKDVDYRRFLNRFRVAVTGGLGSDRWLEELLGRFFGRLLALQGSEGSLAELEKFLGGADGTVSATDALECFRGVLGDCISAEQATALLRTLTAHCQPELSPKNNSLSVAEFISRLDIVYQHESNVSRTLDGSGSGSAQPKEPVSQWARSVLAHLGRLLWMEDADGSPKAGSKRMLTVFKYFDEDGDGLLQRSEFAEAVKTMLSEYKEELPPALVGKPPDDAQIDELVSCVDVAGDGVVNYLEFLHAFQPVDRTPGRGLRTDLMEQICTTIWANKPSLLRTFEILEESPVATPTGAKSTKIGNVSQENLRCVLRSLNASLTAARGSAHGMPLTNDQIDILVDHAAIQEDGMLDYNAFLDAFQIVDTGAPPEDELSPPETPTASVQTATPGSRTVPGSTYVKPTIGVSGTAYGQPVSIARTVMTSSNVATTAKQGYPTFRI